MKNFLIWCFFLVIFVIGQNGNSRADQTSDHVPADSLLYQIWMRRLQTAPPISSPSTTREPEEIRSTSLAKYSSLDEHTSVGAKGLVATNNKELVRNQTAKTNVAVGEQLIDELTTDNFTTSIYSMDTDDVTLNDTNASLNMSDTSNLYENSTKSEEDYSVNCLNISVRMGNFTDSFPGAEPLCLEDNFPNNLDFQKTCNDTGTGSWEGVFNNTDHDLENSTRVVQNNSQPCVTRGPFPPVQNIIFEKSILNGSLENESTQKKQTEDSRNSKERNTTKQQSEHVQNSSRTASLLPSTTQNNFTVDKFTSKKILQQSTRTDYISVEPQQSISRSTKENIATLQSAAAKDIQNVSQLKLSDDEHIELVSTQLPPIDRTNYLVSQETQFNSNDKRPAPPYSSNSPPSTSSPDAVSDSPLSPHQLSGGRQETYRPQQQKPDVHNHKTTNERDPPGGVRHSSGNLVKPSSHPRSSNVDEKILSTHKTSFVDSNPSIQTSFVQSNPATQNPTNSGYMDRTTEYDPLSNRGGPFLRKPNAFDFLMMGQIATAKKTESQLEFREGNLEASALICGLLNKQFCRLSIGGRCC